MKCKTILQENNYIDRDYLVDFAHYYVRCFTPYGRLTKRIHFFSKEFDKQLFLSALNGSKKNINIIKKNYIGFIVAKPLPEAIIGRTLLGTYENGCVPTTNNAKRFFTCVYKQKINLFGIDMELESLEYQEQDAVTAACATSALWSAFHQTDKIFKGTWAPTPVEITESANKFWQLSRPIPSSGLTVMQMCQAIHEVGLEAYVHSIEDQKDPYMHPLISLIYAYLKMGVPVILHAEINGDDHAVTLNGYCLEEKQHIPREVKRNYPYIPLVGRRISKFYAHDDQIGPFCKLEIVQKILDPYKIEKYLHSYKKILTYEPISIIVPLYTKIRVVFLDVFRWVKKFHDFLKAFNRIIETNIEWNIYLCELNTFRNQVLSGRLYKQDRSRLLRKSLPHYIWRIELNTLDGNKILEIIADATDMKRSFFFKDMVYFNSQFKTDIHNLLNDRQVRTGYEHVLTEKLFNFLFETSQ
jgi:hypothetical protein